MTRRRAASWLLLAAVSGGLVVSYATGGLVRVLFDAALDGRAGVQIIREYVLSWGALAPLIYVVATTVEVIVAPIPGLLLYAPGGAIFGGWWGGTLSLVGNVIGATIAAFIGRMLGEPWVAARMEEGRLHEFRERLSKRAVWVVALLRVNPLTSTDLVSYAAGALGISPVRVGLGSLIGLAPLCYAQAYAAEAIFEWVPMSGVIVVGFGVAYGVAVIWVMVRKRGR